MEIGTSDKRMSFGHPFVSDLPIENLMPDLSDAITKNKGTGTHCSDLEFVFKL